MGYCFLLRKNSGEGEIHEDYWSQLSEGGACDFVRQYTLASGGPYCGCGYKKQRR